jgi:hypothetical protein
VDIAMRDSTIRTYSKLITYSTFEDRFHYLSLKGQVGEETYGFDRWVNQKFYKSREWKQIRDYVIVRDSGCDLGILGREIPDRIIVHHINPILVYDIQYATEYLLNPEYLICVSNNTHQAIHYGDENLLITMPAPRAANDTCPWKH